MIIDLYKSILERNYSSVSYESFDPRLSLDLFNLAQPLATIKEFLKMTDLEIPIPKEEFRHKYLEEYRKLIQENSLLKAEVAQLDEAIQTTDLTILNHSFNLEEIQKINTYLLYDNATLLKYKLLSQDSLDKLTNWISNSSFGEHVDKMALLGMIRSLGLNDQSVVIGGGHHMECLEEYLEKEDYIMEFETGKNIYTESLRALKSENAELKQTAVKTLRDKLTVTEAIKNSVEAGMHAISH